MNVSHYLVFNLSICPSSTKKPRSVQDRCMYVTNSLPSRSIVCAISITMDDSEKHSGVQSTYIGVGHANDPYDSAKSNAADRRDMARMGKPQEMRVSELKTA
jgi:hypothetical protein